jgi:hypothetical protein
VSTEPRLAPTRSSERAGIRAVTEFFEKNDCVVQPVNGENDFGKDLYVDLTRDTEITGVTCAIQVKSGPSYRTANGYRIPIDHHLHCWRDSTIPVLGIVCDPERSVLVWINLTQHLRTRQDDLKHVPLHSSAVLDGTALRALEASIRETSTASHPLAQLWSASIADVREAVWDCMAIGRRDARVLKGLRASISLIDDSAIPAIIRILSSLTSHPDRAWSPSNWIEEAIRKPVREMFRWTAFEVIRLARAAAGEWERGTVGQDVTLLLAEDPVVCDVLREAIERTYESHLDESWMLFCLYLHFSGENAREAMSAVLPTYPEFRRHPAFRTVYEVVEEHGSLGIAD